MKRITILLIALFCNVCYAQGHDASALLWQRSQQPPDDACIRDAALVRVNGKDAGAVWMPPWRLDVTSLLRPGKNEIEVVVMNTAINALSARRPQRLIAN